MAAARHVHTDFLKAFTPGMVFEDSKGRRYEARLYDAGEVVLPTGRIVACDPTYLQTNALDSCRPFQRSVSPGRYPVVLSLCRLTWGEYTDERVAAAMIRFSDAEPMTWELALCPGQDLATLSEDGFFGYGVDAGQGCFTDARAVDALEPERAAFEDLLDQRMARDAEGRSLPIPDQTPFFQHLHEVTERSFSNQEWASSVVVDAESGANLITFTSGWGDGGYPSYWGLDQTGTPCQLVTDFGILLETLDETVVLPIPPDGGTLHHPELVARGLVSLQITQEYDESKFPFSPDIMQHILSNPEFGNVPLLHELFREPLPAPDHCLQVHYKGGGCLTAEPVLRAGAKTYKKDRSTSSEQQGTTIVFQLDEPLPPNAELVLRYKLRTVAL